MRITDVNKDDMLFCVKAYIDTEIPRSLRKYAGYDVKLVHLRKGIQYKVISKNDKDTEVCVINDFGITFWYNIKHFDNIKEWRRLKLINLENNTI